MRGFLVILDIRQIAADLEWCLQQALEAQRPAAENHRYLFTRHPSDRDYFDGNLEDLSQDQLLDYFCELLERLSWSAVKLDLYSLKFFYTHVLNNPWTDIALINPTRTVRIPDIVTVAEV